MKQPLWFREACATEGRARSAIVSSQVDSTTRYEDASAQMKKPRTPVVSGERPGLYYSYAGDPLSGHVIDSPAMVIIRLSLFARHHRCIGKA
jgi:hypothetical protein